MSIGAAMQRQEAPAIIRRSAGGSMRIVVAGFDDAAALEEACADLARKGLARLELCRFGLETGLPGAEASRRVNGLALSVFAAALFDSMRIARTETTEESGGWMPAAQAGVLWRHIRSGRPALLVKAGSPDEQVGCSRVLLRHRPSFVHTANFNA